MHSISPYFFLTFSLIIIVMMMMMMYRFSIFHVILCPEKNGSSFPAKTNVCKRVQNKIIFSINFINSFLEFLKLLLNNKFWNISLCIQKDAYYRIFRIMRCLKQKSPTTKTKQKKRNRYKIASTTLQNIQSKTLTNLISTHKKIHAQFYSETNHLI